MFTANTAVSNVVVLSTGRLKKRACLFWRATGGGINRREGQIVFCVFFLLSFGSQLFLFFFPTPANFFLSRRRQFFLFRARREGEGQKKGGLLWRDTYQRGHSAGGPGAPHLGPDGREAGMQGYSVGEVRAATSAAAGWIGEGRPAGAHAPVVVVRAARAWSEVVAGWHVGPRCRSPGCHDSRGCHVTGEPAEEHVWAPLPARFPRM